jgi:hypothetical protein
MGESDGPSSIWCCTIFEARKTPSSYRKNDDATVGQLRGSFIDVLDRMVDDTRDKILAQSLDYEALRGEVFSKKSAKENMDSMSPRKCCF